MKLFVLYTIAFLAVLFLFDSWRSYSPTQAPVKEITIAMEVAAKPAQKSDAPLPSFDRINELFRLDSPLPFVETLTYKPKVNWLKGRSAWVIDYANHFATSRYFIYRSLGKEEARDGDRFNVLKLDYPFHFHLLLDITRKQLWLAAVDEQEDKVEWLKNYTVCVGRHDVTRPSGYLTPTGTYALGDRIAVYAPESKGYYQGERVDMIHHFGTRWIPFEKEIKNCSSPAKSYGIHGVPWVKGANGWHEDCSSLGKNESDGCIRLKTSDVEELYSIISARAHSTTIEITHDFAKADLIP